VKRLLLVVGLLAVIAWTGTGSRPAAQEANRSARRPRIWAVVVGIDRYVDPAIPDGRANVKNAGQLLQWFFEVGGLERGQALLLADLGSRQPGPVDDPRPNILPTRANLTWVFERWLPSRAKEGDLVVVYYAGRVGTVAVPGAGAPAAPVPVRTEHYLLPNDANRGDVAATGWSLDRALDRLVRDLRGRCQIVCLLAASSAGVPGPAGSRPAGAAGAARSTGREWLGRLARWPGVSAWLASDRPVVNVATDDPASLFTRGLVRGLGKTARKQNLAACLQTLQRDPALKRQGFQTLGGIPPRTTLWPDVFAATSRAKAPEVLLQLGHADKVTAAIASADGQHAITASMDSTIRVWSLKDRSLERVLTGHEVGATALAMSPDGRWLVSGGGRPSSGVLVHDAENDYRQVVQEQPHRQAVAQVVMLPDGRHFVSVDLGARNFVWDTSKAPPEPRHWLDRYDERNEKPIETVDCLEVAVGGDDERGKVAALCGDRAVRIFSASGAGPATVKRWAEQPATIAVDPQARWLAAGFEDGRVVLLDLASGGESTLKAGAGAVARLAFSADGMLAVGHAGGLGLYRVQAGPLRAEPCGPALADEAPATLVFSNDGGTLAAAARDTGRVRVWRIEGNEARPLGAAGEAEAGASALALAGDGRGLVIGEFKGSIQWRPLDQGPEERVWTVPPNRGKVQHLSVSPGRRLTLVINDLGHAQLLDLKERTCRKLPGTWTSGVFAAADNQLVLTEAADAERPGRVVRVRLEDDRTIVDSTFFEPVPGVRAGEMPALVAATISPDGARVACAADPAQDPLVCVWDTKTGRLTHWIADPTLADPVRCLSFSSDARYLLTGGDAAAASLWDLGAGQGALTKPAATFAEPDARNITACLIRPGAVRQVVTGHRNGLVRLWNWQVGKAEAVGPPLVLAEGMFSSEVKALAFVSVGSSQYLTAAGDGTLLWVARMDEPRPRTITNLGRRPHHHEQVNTLVAWPAVAGAGAGGNGAAAPTFLSGSDDTTVKLWQIKGASLSLLGTFSTAAGRRAGPAPKPAPGVAEDVDWVLFTPDGHFDASPRGRELVRFRLGGSARAMEQFDETPLYTFDLGERLVSATPAAQVAGLVEPPPLAIESAPRADATRPDAEVTVSLGSPALRDVRLYQNNVPIASGLETAGAGGAKVSVPVRLVKGTNQFYAMATAPAGEGSFDSRSPEVVLPYEGPMDPGLLHVVALGVSDYQRRRLKFADHDAERLSEVLHERGLRDQGKGGMRIVRTNSDVTTEGVTKAFTQVARAVKGRPQDTVVVFLAGHTGVMASDQFCLLLPSYPFAPEAPPRSPTRSAVVAREGGKTTGPVRSRDVMPYAVIEANLMRLDALNRLVIVDACQAESIFDDAQVKQIRRWMEIKSRRIRTSYLMAARRGEPALEVEGLRHGIFTYALLRGMGGGAIERQLEPREVTQLKLPENADFDHDGVITTGELEGYAKSSLPAIARLYPALMTRSRNEIASRNPQTPPLAAGELEQDLRMQSANVSFPLVPLAAKP
jgi:WD40 repeat protein/uncharacterized caspase-like protein